MRNSAREEVAMRLYLDNCSFNRPYDDQTVLRNYLEAEAKTYIQRGILAGRFELAWSYMMDYEVSFNPFSERKTQIVKWKRVAKIDVDESEGVVVQATEFERQGIKPKDALHLACAIETKCDYFITTDSKLLNKPIHQIVVSDPVGFVRLVEERQ